MACGPASTRRQAFSRRRAAALSRHQQHLAHLAHERHCHQHLRTTVILAGGSTGVGGKGGATVGSQPNPGAKGTAKSPRAQKGAKAQKAY